MARCRMMRRWKCAECGAVFAEPDEVSWQEEMSGDGWAWEKFTELYCPNCGSQEIGECIDDGEVSRPYREKIWSIHRDL